MTCSNHSDPQFDVTFFDQDASFMQELAAERDNLSSPVIEYYIFDRSANVDPLYNEPVDWSYKGPFRLRASVQFVEWDNRDESVRDEGYESSWDATVGIAKLNWDRFVGEGYVPKTSDVLKVNGRWWDVAMKTGESGAVLDTDKFVGYQLGLVARSKFTPDRKIPDGA